MLGIPLVRNERDIYPCGPDSNGYTYSLGSGRRHQLLQSSHRQRLLNDEHTLRQIRRYVLVGNVLEETVPVTKSFGGQADTLPRRRAGERDHVLLQWHPE